MVRPAAAATGWVRGVDPALLSRRRLLGGLGLGTVAAAVGCACWAKVAPLLSAAGHRTVAVDLPGHGVFARFPAAYLRPGQQGLDAERTPLVDVTLETTAQAVVATLRSVRADAAGRPTVLLGHSLAGAVIIRAVQLAPDQVDHLVYLAATVPVRLRSTIAYFALPEAGRRTRASTSARRPR